ncbi:cell division cycle 5-like protein [Brassica napus]|uniref:cell division cycle 5-like protein n=1 Tax=Brassica napus TaxID=3708 RepID=UPI00207908D9|nr:cell division cycle 5-like protein [Brassica napus]
MWKKHEDEKLKVGVERYGPNAWKRVSASIMNHRRSPLSCKERYKILMEPKFWTVEEDLKLKNEVAKFGYDVQWTTIASVMNRSFLSCKNRYDFLMDETSVTMPPTATSTSKSSSSENFKGGNNSSTGGPRRGMKRKIQC